MAILHRFGSADDFDPNKMKARELAYVNTTNVHYKAGLYLCYAPGDVRRLTTEQDIQDILSASPEAYLALQQLITDLGDNPSELTNILSNISALQVGLSGAKDDIEDLQENKLDKTGDSKDNTVSFTEAETDTDIVSGESHSTILGKILKSIKTLRSGKINKTDITHQAETDDENKVPSSKVTHYLQDEIDELNDDLSPETLVMASYDAACISFLDAVIKRSGNIVTVSIVCDVIANVPDGQTLFTLPVAPTGLASLSIGNPTKRYDMRIFSDGTARAWGAMQPGTYLIGSTSFIIE